MKQFDVPLEYRSSFITEIKNIRKQKDKLKKDFTPTVLDFGVVKFLVARHFGFCYGVENAIEIAYKCIRENPGKRIFLLSEMIHNPHVNKDLMDKGIQFLQDTYGQQLVPYSELTSEDIVIIPAFGTTLHVESELEKIGISPKKYNTTCPFVEKVWNRGEALAGKGYSLVVHGKPKHEETRATFSRSAANTPTVIVNDMKDTVELAKYITKEKPYEDFYTEFAGLYSSDFNPEKHLSKLGVINQTTQLATDTQEIADYLKQVIVKHYELDEHHTAEYFADTRDTLCYATNDNQSAVLGMLEADADLAIVVGGYNSSNTSHLVELCEKKLKTYYISSANEIADENLIHHFGWRTKERLTSNSFLPDKAAITIMVTSGASCPDAMVEEVIKKILSFKGIVLDTELAIKNLQ